MTNIEQLLIDCHPGGIHSHIPIVIPGWVSSEGKSLLRQVNVSCYYNLIKNVIILAIECVTIGTNRLVIKDVELLLLECLWLGYGLNGIDDIKSHPFFNSINWNTLSQYN
jgi:hypothetical protein